MNIGQDYLETMKARRKTSGRVSQPYQLIGLEIADILSDRRHKALYIKLAKEMNMLELLRMAKNVDDSKNIRNKGAYFMKILFGENAKRAPASVAKQVSALLAADVPATATTTPAKK